MRADQAVDWGADYSAGEFTPGELDQYNRTTGGVPINFLWRYVGYPGNTKCISHYPGAYQAHWQSGRPVGLFHQIAYRDFEGGYDSGRAHATTALDDARRNLGWDGESPILACFDRYMVKEGYRTIPIGECREYVRGFVSVVGWDNAGFYGFYDTMSVAVREQWTRVFMQCGAREHHVPGIQLWQQNNFQPMVLGVQTDQLESYVPLSEVFNAMAVISDDDAAKIARKVWEYGLSARVKESGTTDDEGNPIWTSEAGNMLGSVWAELFNSTEGYEGAFGAFRARTDAALATLAERAGLDVGEVRRIFREELAGTIRVDGEIRVRNE